MGNKCLDLKKSDDPCTIGECVKFLKGIPSNSASPTDVWVIHFNYGTRYNNKDINNAFMKIFISPNNDYEFKTKNFSDGLRYELEIYNNVVNILLDYNICPNYVRCYATSKNCSFSNIVKILENGLEDTFGPGNEQLYKDRVIRSYFYMANKGANRPAIDKESYVYIPLTEEIKERAINSKYDFIINESLHDTITLFQFLEDEKDPEIMYNVMFQVFCACYGLVLSKTNHNDLHNDNVFVQFIDEITLHYNINDNIYSLKTKYLVKIFDYDRSYCINIGNNELSTSHKLVCGYSNNFVPIKDVWQILFYCKQIPDIFSVIAKEEKYIDEFLKFEKAENFRFNNGNYMTIKDIEKYTCSIEETLTRTAEKLKLKNEYNGGILYLLKRELFDNGILKIDMLADYELNELDIIKSNKGYEKHDYRELYNILEKSNSHKFSL